MEEKAPLLQMLEFNSNILVRNYFFLESYITSEGAVSHNVLYYQQLSVSRYQVSFCANNDKALQKTVQKFIYIYVHQMADKYPEWKRSLCRPQSRCVVFGRRSKV